MVSSASCWIGRSTIRLSLVVIAALQMCGGATLAAQDRAKGIDLSHWKLTLPVDSAGTTTGNASEISAKQLTSGYRNDAYFQIDAQGAIVFWCPVTGAKTKDTEYPRSELREVLNPEDDNVTWPAPGTHILNATCRVIEVPSTQKVIIGQIHSYSGKARPLIKLQFFKGRIEALIKVSPTMGQDKKLTFADVGLNTDFDYQIKLQDGLLSITVNDQTQSENIYTDDEGWAKETFYFKAGAYCQDNEGPETEGTRVSFSRLTVSH